MPDVVVVGAGPVGLLLAGDLAAAGVDVELLERRPAPGAGTRAIGVHAPVLAALEGSGVTEALLADALRVGRGHARAGDRLLGVVRFDRMSSRFPFVATLPQSATEAALLARAPAPTRGATVWAAIPRADAVHVRYGIAGRPAETTAPIVVVAGGVGARDVVFRPVAVHTHQYRDRYLMADAAAGPDADPGVAVVNLHAHGVLESFPLPGGLRRYVAWDAAPDDAGADTDRSAAGHADSTALSTAGDSSGPAASGSAASGPAASGPAASGPAASGPAASGSAAVDVVAAASRAERLRRAMTERGEAAASASITEATGFGVRRTVAPRMRNDRLFVVGDTAHEVSPIGGQGMNLGLLDAATLAPLLAAWVRTGEPPEAALRRWEGRRLAAARTAARLASVNTALGRPLAGVRGAARRVGVRAMLTPPLDRTFARAYSMGFDPDA